MFHMLKRSRALIATLSLSVALTGCDIEGINDDPNGIPVGQAAPLQLLAGAQKRLGDVYLGQLNQQGNEWTGGIITAYGLQVGATQRYQLTPLTFNGVWNVTYAEVLFELDQIEKAYPGDASNAANDQHHRNVRGLTKTLKAFAFQYLVDLFGDVPYSEAFQGLDNLTPAYDTQQEVYDANVAQLTTAINIMSNTTDATIGGNDAMLGGDMAKWKRFARTLKLRYLIRQSALDATSRPWISDSIATLMGVGPAGFLGAGDDITLQPGYTASPGKETPIAALYRQGDCTSFQGHSYRRANRYAIDKLLAQGDFRRFTLFRAVPVTGGPFDGTRRGWTLGSVSPSASGDSSSNPNDLSRPGIAVYNFGGAGTVACAEGSSRQAYLMLASESFFLQAEALARGWGGSHGSTAELMYNEGIRESFRFSMRQVVLAGATTISGQAATPANAETLANAQIAKPEIALSAATDDIEQIIEQKWISQLNLNGFENWTEWRRTDFPRGIRLSNSAQVAAYPARALYPQQEVIANSANLPPVTNFFDNGPSRIFWDVAANTVTGPITGPGN